METNPLLRLTIALPIILSACLSQEARPSITFTVEALISEVAIEYYDISGSTGSELRSQLDVLGPVGYDGYRGDATTRWNVTWHWPVQPDGTCQLSEAVVSYEVTVVFPQWDPPKGASPELIEKWQKYLQDLATHEKGHVNILVGGVQKVEEAIKAATCETADVAGEAILVEIREKDLDYDLRTDHGAAQGARFSP